MTKYPKWKEFNHRTGYEKAIWLVLGLCALAILWMVVGSAPE